MFEIFSSKYFDVDMIGLLTATSEERTYVKDDIVTKMMLLEISDDKYGLSLFKKDLNICFSLLL